MTIFWAFAVGIFTGLVVGYCIGFYDGYIRGKSLDGEK